MCEYGLSLITGVVPIVLAGSILLALAGDADEPKVIRERGITKIRLLPPGPDNPRKSEGDFIQLPNGRLVFVYTHFYAGAGDHAGAYLAARYSTDGGRTWSERDEEIVPNEGGMNVMSVSLLRLQSGDIALFYLRKNALDDCRLYMRISDDEAHTWSEPRLCTPDQGYFVVNNDRVVQLSDGRLVVPTSRHNIPGGGWTGRGVAMCFLSDDNGRTWYRSETVLQAPKNSDTGLQEPGVIELKDGRLMMLCRTDLGCQMRSWSEDGGVTWSEPEMTQIKSPVSPASFERIPSTGDILLVYNDHSDITEEYRGRRTPFNVAISKDEGRTWENVKVIEDDPDGWYCYTAIQFVEDHVVLGHCAGNREIGGLNLTQITLIDIDWLYD